MASALMGRTGLPHNLQNVHHTTACAASTAALDHSKTRIGFHPHAMGMPQPLIADQQRFDELCEHVERLGIAAMDTEFLGEFTYRPQLCLLQIATPERAVAVDPLAVPDLSRWWQLAASGEIQLVVHGGREEIRFILHRAGVRPPRLFDVQIAEGLQSRAYPLSYAALVSRVLGRKLHSHETRTDWRKRPLTSQQISYALDDVAHLLPVYERQRRTLDALGRLHWAEAECAHFVAEVELDARRENWHKLPGLAALGRRELAVVREIYRWREHEAQASDKPPRRILRDDLVIELARRKPRELHDLMATRDMNRKDYRRNAGGMLAAIERGLAVPEHDLPAPQRNDRDPDEQILAQLLSIALANRCAQLNVALALVGTASDLRHLVRWHVQQDHDGPRPRLTQGWRAEVCGDLLSDVLAGRIALRVADPKSDHPLIFERRNIHPGSE
jgi:ribonuclease D